MINKRLFTLTLAAALLSASLYSCSSDVSDGETSNGSVTSEAATEAVTTEKDIMAPFEELDFNGVTLNIDNSINGDEFNSSSKYVMGYEEEVGETVSDLVYIRNRDIAEIINVNINWIKSELSQLDKIRPFL